MDVNPWRLSSVYETYYYAGPARHYRTQTEQMACF